MRHEVPLGVPDPFLYAEQDGARHVVDRLDGRRPLAERRLYDAASATSSGSTSSTPRPGMTEIVPSSPCAPPRVGITSAVVPETFPLELADHLRANGIELTADRDSSSAARQDRGRARRHPPRPARRRGRDGRGARAAPRARRERRRRSARSSATSGASPSTARARRVHRLAGPQGAVGHDMGSGPIAPGEPVVLDLLAARQRAVRRHDAHLRRRRADRGARGTGSARQALDRASSEIGDGASGRRSSTALRDLRAASRRCSRSSRRGAQRRLLPLARPRRRPRGARGAGARAAASAAPRGRRGHGRAGPLPRRLRRRRLEDLVLVTTTAPRTSRTTRTTSRRMARRGHAIETMLLEERRYPPPPEFAAQANAQPEIYDERLRGVLGARGPRARHVVRAVRRAATSGSRRTRSGSSAASSTSPTTASTATSRPGAATRSPTTGRASPTDDRRDDHLRRPPARGRPLRERAEGARRREGHAGRDLHGHGPGAAGRDARVRAARRAAHGRLRRLLRRLALRPPERHGLRGADHAGRGVAARHDRAAEATADEAMAAAPVREARASSCGAPATTCR